MVLDVGAFTKALEVGCILRYLSTNYIAILHMRVIQKVHRLT